MNLGGSSSGAASGPFDPSATSTVFEIFDDFLNGVNSGEPYGQMGWDSISNGSGGSNLQVAPGISEKNTIGIWRCTTGSGAGTYGGIVANLSAVLCGDSTLTYAVRFRINTLADAVDDFDTRIGFSNTWPTTQHGFEFEYSRTASVNWRLITVQSSTATTTTTAVPVDTNWHVVKMVVTNAASCAFYLDGVLLNTHVANLPTTVGQVCGPVFMSTKTLGTLNRGMDIDWAYLRYTVGTARGVF